jgi:ABC-type Fe3+-hydroxamate transport system substrate-binding protein
MLAVVDKLGREMLLPHQPRRIVSLVPSQTELLADLGLEEEVVGITKFCVHPERWFRSKARVGGTKTVSIEKVAALKPDLIIANKEENVQGQIEALEDVAPVWVSDIHSLEDALKMIRQVGGICGKAQESLSIAEKIETGFASLAFGSGGKVAYCIWREPWMWAGNDTFIHEMLAMSGWENALAHVPRYPELSLEALAEQAPDYVFLSSEPYPFKEKHVAEIHAVLPNVKVMLVDGELFSWYGSRLLNTPGYISRLHRDLGIR